MVAPAALRRHQAVSRPGVVAIVSTLAVGVTLSVGRGSGGDGDLDRFRAAWALQQALAIEGREMRGLRLSPKGMEVMVWRLGEMGGAWQAQGDLRPWQGRVAVSVDRPTPPGAPDIVFLPDGRGSAFSVAFAVGSARCESDGWAELTCG